MRPTTGFTLIELLVTVAVAAILAVVAVPGFRSLMQGNRAATQTNTLVSALTFARSEAIRRGTTVSMCPSSNQTSCTGGTDWSVGWVVFRDADGDGEPGDATDLLRVWQSLSGPAALSGPQSQSFMGTGQAVTSASFSYTASGVPTRMACVNNVGRTELKKGVATC
ncbi:GspH/FimT family pseudopilin [Algiphilus sp.]|uniref:GspH/FimT family pseudopilin n=1 Tax=Algiphilus sp. TaxID=1872431 RepID=UPI0025BCAC82|nr:GspH/FimT family pseudopilin [Algiphilus sp.]MCK5769780.1 GspH/FimT family pseudopilin [Algiphilus sp.]